MSEPRPDGDWASRTADSIERVVLAIRDRTTRPILLAGRAVVYAVLAAILGIAAVVLLAILVIRLLTALTGEAWIAEIIVGGVFCIIGIVLLIMRRLVSEAI
ncbi:MAG TPA: hypothetical protein VKD67_09470 [Acidimicrobiales bacterium]|nr:hypothetical protein [Acidimicrobiales bacterium]